MSFEVNMSVVPRLEDWADTSFTVTVDRSKHLRVGSTIKVGPLVEPDTHLQVTLYNPEGHELGTTPSDYGDNGLLMFSGITLRDGETVNGEPVPAGTRFWIVASMIIMVETDPDTKIEKREKHITGLTLIDDPQNAGVMGAEETGTGPDTAAGASR